MDPQTEQVTWETSKNDCQAPRRTPGNIHLQLEISDVNQAERVSEAKKTSNEMGTRHQRILATSQSPQRQQRSHERSDLARHGARWLEWDSMETVFVSSRFKQPKRPTTAISTTTTTKATALEHTTHTTEAHDHDEAALTTTTKTTSTTLRILFNIIESGSSTTTKQPQPTNQHNGNQCSSDKLHCE